MHLEEHQFHGTQPRSARLSTISSFPRTSPYRRALTTGINEQAEAPYSRSTPMPTVVADAPAAGPGTDPRCRTNQSHPATQLHRGSSDIQATIPTQVTYCPPPCTSRGDYRGVREALTASANYTASCPITNATVNGINAVTR